MVKAIWFALIILAVWFGIILFRDFVKHKNNLENVSWGKTAIIGFIVNFLTFWELVHLHLKQLY